MIKSNLAYSLAYSFIRFLNAVLPFDHPTLRSAIAQRETFEVHKDSFLPTPIESAIAKLFELYFLFFSMLNHYLPPCREISFEIKIEPLKAQMTNEKISACFQIIDSGKKGYIDFNSLKEFLEKNNYLPYEEEVIGIIHRLDKDDDGRVTEKEFLQELSAPLYTAFQDTSLSLTSSAKKASMLSSAEKKQGEGLKSPPKHTNFDPVRKSISPSKDSQDLSQKKGAEISISRFQLEKDSTSKKTYQSPFKTTTNQSPLKTQSMTQKTSSIEKQSKTEMQKFYRSSPYGEIKKSEKTVSESKIEEVKVEKKSPGKTIENVSKTFLEKKPEKPKYQEETKTSEGLKLKSPQKWQKEGKEEAMPIPGYFISFLREFSRLLEEVEWVKEEMAQCADFNILEFFRHFDEKTNGFINSSEFEEGLAKFGVTADQDSLFLFIRRYDSNKDGLISFSDFSEAITPKRPEFAGIIVSRSQYFKEVLPSKVAKVRFFPPNFNSKDLFQ